MAGTPDRSPDTGSSGDPGAGSDRDTTRVLVVARERAVFDRLRTLLEGVDRGTVSLAYAERALDAASDPARADLVVFGPGCGDELAALRVARPEVPTLLLVSGVRAAQPAWGEELAWDDGVDGDRIYAAMRRALDRHRRLGEASLQRTRARIRVAREIQSGLFPAAAPTVPGFDIAGATRPAEEVDGDYYDFLELGGGSLAVAVGDACGHGLGAALLMMETRATLITAAGHVADPDALLATANRALCRGTEIGHFVTLLLMRLDRGAGRIRYASAGHLPGYCLDADGIVRGRLPSTDVPLGVDPAARFPLGASVELAPGAMVVLFTDGIEESRSARGEPFGAARALEVVRAHRAEPARTIVEAVQTAVARFCDGYLDDVTSVVVKRTAAA